MLDKQTTPDPNRFNVSRATLWLDRAMGWIIRAGGIAVILAVFGIFYFIGKEVVPLFHDAKINNVASFSNGIESRVLGVDEWGEMPFFYDGGKSLIFINVADGKREVLDVSGLTDLTVRSFAYDPVHRRIALGLEDGRVGAMVINYERKFAPDGSSSIAPSAELEPWQELSHGSGPVVAVSHGDSGDGRVIVAQRQAADGSSQVSILKLAMKRGLIGKGKLSLVAEVDVTSQLSAPASLLRASSNASMVLIATTDGKVHYFLADGDGVSKRQVFQPHGELALRQLDFLFGGVSLVATSENGDQAQWSLFRPENQGERLFGETKKLPALEKGEIFFAASQRNRTFLTGSNKKLAIIHSTSGVARWAGTLDIAPTTAVIDAKGEHFFVADAAGAVRKFAIHDPHPEAGWRAFFGKVWYEGGSKPVYQWQSTGGTDDFEPKLSLIPLIYGSLKGTAYALLFSVPVALLAAIFSAAFLPLEIKRVVKPVMEIMSSLPSVVLGFLAGLWLAPIWEMRVPSVLMITIMLPISALAMGYIGCRLPPAVRNRFENGREWLVVLPVMALFAWLGWHLGPLLERWLFIYRDPTTQQAIADFRLWWPQFTGTPFEQRNSLVLGFMMGFAVIPVIFTIAEDALSNVPKSLTAAAAALGANRWQVVRTVMLPVASSGIFSALMIGFGRAVGETMIMVMATGNTPVMDWNIFNGMRTLSANIAVELPEAPVGSTHYRTLFLGAVVLFAMTFFMNTLAEILRQRLRERNKIV